MNLDRFELFLLCLATGWMAGSLILQIVTGNNPYPTLISTVGLLLVVIARIIRKRGRFNA